MLCIKTTPNPTPVFCKVLKVRDKQDKKVIPPGSELKRKNIE